jgi:hypothetical protein
MHVFTSLVRVLIETLLHQENQIQLGACMNTGTALPNLTPVIAHRMTVSLSKVSSTTMLHSIVLHVLISHTTLAYQQQNVSKLY